MSIDRSDVEGILQAVEEHFQLGRGSENYLHYHPEDPGRLNAAIAALLQMPDPFTFYSRVDGTRDFTGTVGGVPPVALTDFVLLQTLIDAIGAHNADPSAHPQFLTQPEADLLYEVIGAVAAHEAKVDPHGQYLNRARLITDPVLMMLMAGA